MKLHVKGQNNAVLTLSPRLHVKPLITAIRAIGDKPKNFGRQMKGFGRQ